MFQVRELPLVMVYDVSTEIRLGSIYAFFLSRIRPFSGPNTIVISTNECFQRKKKYYLYLYITSRNGSLNGKIAKRNRDCELVIVKHSLNEYITKHDIQSKLVLQYVYLLSAYLAIV